MIPPKLTDKIGPILTFSISNVTPSAVMGTIDKTVIV